MPWLLLAGLVIGGYILMGLISTTADLKTRYNISPELAAAITTVATELGMNPTYLFKVIRFETGGTYSVSVRNSVSGATGLIQFMPSTAKKLGTTTDKLAKLSISQQMEYVRKYFTMVKNGEWDGLKGPLDTPQAVYMAVFYPKYRYVPVNTIFPVAVQAANPGIKTVYDYIQKVERYAGA